MFEKKKISKLYFVFNLNKQFTIVFNLFKSIDYRSFYALNKNLHLFNYRHKQTYFYFTHNPYGYSLGEIDTCIESLQVASRQLFTKYKWHTLLQQKLEEISVLNQSNKDIDKFVSTSKEHDEIEVSIRQLVGLNNQRLKKRNEIITRLIGEHGDENIDISLCAHHFAHKFLEMLIINDTDKALVELYILHLIIDDIEVQFENG